MYTQNVSSEAPARKHKAIRSRSGMWFLRHRPRGTCVCWCLKRRFLCKAQTRYQKLQNHENSFVYTITKDADFTGIHLLPQLAQPYLSPMHPSRLIETSLRRSSSTKRDEQCNEGCLPCLRNAAYVLDFQCASVLFSKEESVHETTTIGCSMLPSR